MEMVRETPPAELEPIRDAMLRALGEPVPDPWRLLFLRICHAADAERLWFLRVPLMEAVAQSRGEANASRELARITGMFRT